MADEGFLGRWSRRKQQARGGEPLPEEPAAPSAPPVVAATAPPALATPAGPAPVAAEAQSEAPPPEPLPTLEDVAALTRDSDYSRFVRPGVDEDVKRAAMKKLFFSDPHFNTMDGLDVYIDDYSKPDPIPASMLRQLAQSKMLGLFDDEEDEAKKAAAAPPPTTGPIPAPPDDTAAATPALEPDENADLRLQPDDAPRAEGAGEGAGGDAGRLG